MKIVPDPEMFQMDRVVYIQSLPHTNNLQDMDSDLDL